MTAAVWGSALITGLLLLDIYQNRHPARNPVSRAAVWSAVWVGVALLFGVGIGLCMDWGRASSFFVAYLVEKSLSIDNLIVMLMIFRSFKIRASSQSRVLKWGILGAIVLRVILIWAGLALLQRFRHVLIVFGALLLWGAHKMLRESEEQDSGEEGDCMSGRLVQVLKAVLRYDDSYRGTDFLHRDAHGQLCATPMLAALLVIELSDLVFAVDSVPCVLGITDDLFIAYSSNLLAVLGLRSLYVLLADALGRLALLRTGLALMMGFVGLKMVLAEWVHVSPGVSLLVILALVAGTTLAALLQHRRNAPVTASALVVCSSAPINRRAGAVLRMLDWKPRAT
eukprot:TRINITY_DN12774_c0_g1_i1.p1 TRINITY_DN12774_c0_g1~~TRINITY_DN12774_c0_g1_i1.p1  ORF type:complete len:340 (-),score=92.47 TRINITY_DN12774_c0_g1_i1:478-1497(-)